MNIYSLQALLGEGLKIWWDKQKTRSFNGTCFANYSTIICGHCPTYPLGSDGSENALLGSGTNRLLLRVQEKKGTES